jgi:hypothetical protein
MLSEYNQRLAITELQLSGHGALAGTSAGNSSSFFASDFFV